MHYIEVSSVFSASHQLRLPDGSLEPLHGHDWRVVVQISAKQLDELETVVDFHVVQDYLGAVIGPWRNSHLNDHEPFKARKNPSAERVAEEIAEQLAGRLAVLPGTFARGLRVTEVRLTEAPGCQAIWRA